MLPNDWDDNSGWNVVDDWESIGVNTSVQYNLLKLYNGFLLISNY